MTDLPSIADQMTRRTILSTVAAVALSGCSAATNAIGSTPTPTPTPTPEDSDHDGVPDEEDDYPDDFLRAEQVMYVEETIALDPDQYETYRLPVSDGLHVLEYDILVKGDRGIDVFVMERGEYVKYTNGETAEMLSAYSGENVGSAIVEQPIGDDDYVLVVDYTAYSTDYGPQSVEVDVLIEVAATSSEES